jgi:RNA polymerase sigma-70 factor (ECF subfamily)
MRDQDEYMYKAIRKGDLKAFERFYNKYQPRLFVYGFGIIHDQDTTKDLVQEAFITFWQNVDHILTDYSVTAYLFKIFHSKCIKHLRMNAIETNFSNLSELKMQEIEISYYNPDNNIMGPIFMHDVEKLFEKAISKLPEKCREIFVLSNQEELKSAEIAIKLGLSVRTVENQIYKAIHILRDEMKEYAMPQVN